MTPAFSARPASRPSPSRSPGLGQPRPHSGRETRAHRSPPKPRVCAAGLPRPAVKTAGGSGPEVIIWSSPACEDAPPTAAVLQGLNRPRTMAAQRAEVNQRVGDRQDRGSSQRLMTEPASNGRPAPGLNSPAANSLVPFQPPPRTPDGRAATRIPGLGAELAAGREQAHTTSEILTVQRKNLSNQPGAL